MTTSNRPADTRSQSGTYMAQYGTDRATLGSRVTPDPRCASWKPSAAIRALIDNVEAGARDNAHETVRSEHRDWTSPTDEHPKFSYYVVSTVEDILWGSKNERDLIDSYGAPGLVRASTKKKISARICAKYAR